MFPLSVGFPLAALAEKVAGRCVGDSQLTISGLCPLDDQKTGALTFIKVRSALALNRALSSMTCAAALVPESVFQRLESGPPVPVIVVADPFNAFVDLVPLFFESRRRHASIHPSAIVHPSATLGRDVFIGPYCVVGPEVELADGAVLHAHVTLYEAVTVGVETELHAGVVVRERCSIGDRCIIHANATIGSDGFGYLPHPTEGLKKVPQVGRVVIGDRVEIGSGTCIDRGALGDTRIGAGTKIDNLVQIGHNTVIGQYSILCGQVGIAGSCTIGDRVVLGGGAGVADHITITSGVRIAARGGVDSSLSEPGDYAGFPIRPAAAWRREQVAQLRRTRNDDEE